MSGWAPTRTAPKSCRTASRSAARPSTTACGAWGDTECKNAFFRRFSCYCKPCYEDLVSGGDFQKCLTRCGVYKGGAYCNDPIKQPILPKKPTAPERQADAAAYAGKLKEGASPSRTRRPRTSTRRWA